MNHVVLTIIVVGSISLCILIGYLAWKSKQPRSERRRVRIKDINVPQEMRGKETAPGPLMLDLAKRGLMRPLHVLSQANGKYLLLDGYQRLLVEEAVGHEDVDCIVYYNIDPIHYALSMPNAHPII